MDTLPNQTIPWELIAESLTGNLSGEGDIQLQQWLLSDPQNQETFVKLRELWINGMEDYAFYQAADGEKGWNALQAKLGKTRPAQPEAESFQVDFTPKTRTFRYMVAAAAMFLGVVGAGLWFLVGGNKPVVYETAANAHQKVMLKDGSSITLSPKTKIVVSDDFNKTSRTVTMTSGEAFFEVGHQKEKPFIVELGSTKIEDIGTSFTIQKNDKEIEVMVASGKVVFVKVSSNDSRELNAGMSVIYHVQEGSFGELKQVNSSSDAQDQLLNFENTPLSEAILSMQLVYKKKITLQDSQIASRKITAHLKGMPYQTALKVICQSLGLEYSITDSIYLLKEKK